MTNEEKTALEKWQKSHCRKCIFNIHKGTRKVGCGSFVLGRTAKGIICLHYEDKDIFNEQKKDKKG